MAAALFGTTVVPSFLGHLGSAEAREHKKDLDDQDNRDGVITHLELDILE